MYQPISDFHDSSPITSHCNIICMTPMTCTVNGFDDDGDGDSDHQGHNDHGDHDDHSDHNYDQDNEGVVGEIAQLVKVLGW